jgi:hypothetical protein
MITGIPPYHTPIEQSIRCTCGLRYVVYLGGGLGDASGRAQERADRLRARFIDASSLPWLVCGCGQVLEFTTEPSLMVQ